MSPYGCPTVILRLVMPTARRGANSARLLLWGEMMISQLWEILFAFSSKSSYNQRILGI